MAISKKWSKILIFYLLLCILVLTNGSSTVYANVDAVIIQQRNTVLSHSVNKDSKSVTASGNTYISKIESNMSIAELKNVEKELIAFERELEEKRIALEAREATILAREEKMGISEDGPFLSKSNLIRIGTVTDQQVKAVEDGFRLLPHGVRQLFVANGYRVEVTNEDLELLITGGGTNSWYGATSNPLKVVLVANNQTLSEMTRTTLHECGHVLGYLVGQIDNSPAWVACYASEGKTLYKTADVHAADEWFSECLVYYLQDPTYLKSVAPLSYTTLDTFLKNVTTAMEK